MVETHLANAVLTNGARFYVDHAHPEYSSPECSSPLQAVLYDAGRRGGPASGHVGCVGAVPGRAEDHRLQEQLRLQGQLLRDPRKLLLAREVPFTEVVRGIVPHLVTRQLFAGAGKVGVETAGFAEAPTYQISQRSEFFEALVGLETTLKRPLVNTRDEPHADAKRYRRLHLILGDANRSQVATFLKLGTTALLLAMIEDGALNVDGLTLADPVAAVRAVSADPELARTVELSDGRRVRPLEIQVALFEATTKYVEAEGGSALGSEVEAADVLERWGRTLEALGEGPRVARLHGRLDRQAAPTAGLRRAPRARAHRSEAAGDGPAVPRRAHRPLPGGRVGLERLVGPEEVAPAVVEPPRTTRAYFRGSCLQRFPDEVTTANWDSMVFDLGTDPLRRVPMMDPLRAPPPTPSSCSLRSALRRNSWNDSRHD